MDMKDGFTPADIGLNQHEAVTAVEGLNAYLANLQVLFIKLHNLHWNVTGVSFFDIHEKTQMLYEFVGDMIDLVAERIKMLGYYPVGSLYEALQLATIKELPNRNFNGPTAANIIVHDFRQLILQLRQISNQVDDSYTGGVVSDGLQFFEKQQWLLSAYLTQQHKG